MNDNKEEEPWCVTCGKLSFNGEFGTKENPYCPYCKKFWEDEDERVDDLARSYGKV